jgi:hypothetical protein
MADLSKLYGRNLVGNSTTPKAVNEACYQTIGGNEPHLYCFTANFKDGTSTSYTYSQLVAVTYHPVGRVVVLFLDRNLGTLEIQGKGLHPIAEALAHHRLESITESVRPEFKASRTSIINILNAATM